MDYEYWRDSDRMTLSQFTEYYKGGYPQALFIESVAKEQKLQHLWLQQGQVVIACHERKLRVLQATVLLRDGGKLPVTIPINLAVQFALLPANNSESFWGSPKLSVKDIVHPKDGCVPKAVRVMENCTNSKKQQVLANVVLFNVTLISRKLGKRGFTGTSANGVRHTFHEGDSAQFSSRLGDNRSFPGKFLDHITFPQKARVYLSGGQQCQVEGLEHLCIVEFTGRHEQQFLDVKTNIDDPESHECQAVPFDLDVLVSAVSLKDYPLDKLTMKDRKMIKHLSTENILQPTGNFYVTKPIDPTIYDEPDPVPLHQPTPSDSRRQSHISIGRSQSSYGVDRKSSQIHVEISYYNWPLRTPEDASHPQSRRESESSVKVSMDTGYYNWPPEDTEVVSHPPLRRGSKIGVTLYPPGFANSAEVLTTCVESPGEYSYAGLDISTQGQSRSPASPSPQHTKLKQRMSLPPQPPPVLPRPQKPDKCNVEVEDKPSQQPARSWMPLQPQTSKSSPSAIPVLHEHSPKPCPKGVPSTAIPLIPVTPPQTHRAIRNPLIPATPPQSPPVHKKPITLTSCPKDPELRYHIAAKLGKDWRSVGTYLGLQHCQLDQAGAAHSKLEDKAMEALVMWLRGQGESKAPRSWETVLEALRLAGQNDMATKLEKDIKGGKLQLSQMQPNKY